MPCRCSICSLANVVVVLMFMSREQGVRSYIEWQLWGTWLIFVVFTGAAIVAVHLTRTRPSFFGVIFAMNCGICFSLMGIIFYRHFLLVGSLFVIVTRGGRGVAGRAMVADRRRLVAGDVRSWVVCSSRACAAATRWRANQNPLTMKRSPPRKPSWPCWRRAIIAAG